MWQGKGGLELLASDHLSVDLSYRYLKLPSFHTNHLGLDAHLKTHVQAIAIGVTWKLGQP
jgi:opacity protein-like surface antigen